MFKQAQYAHRIDALSHVGILGLNGLALFIPNGEEEQQQQPEKRVRVLSLDRWRAG